MKPVLSFLDVLTIVKSSRCGCQRCRGNSVCSSQGVHLLRMSSQGGHWTGSQVTALCSCSCHECSLLLHSLLASSVRRAGVGVQRALKDKTSLVQTNSQPSAHSSLEQIQITNQRLSFLNLNLKKILIITLK